MTATRPTQRSARAPGKRTRESLYVHVSALDRVPELERVAEAARRAAGVRRGGFDVVKFGLRRPRQTVSLLSYPGFFREGFPRLAEAWTVDAAGASSHRSYSGGNPPILHRKEEMLAADHPAVPRFARLTREAERLGLFSGDLNTIGNLAGWRARLARLGLRVSGHRIVATR